MKWLNTAISPHLGLSRTPKTLHEAGTYDHQATTCDLGAALCGQVAATSQGPLCLHWSAKTHTQSKLKGFPSSFTTYLSFSTSWWGMAHCVQKLHRQRYLCFHLALRSSFYFMFYYHFLCWILNKFQMHHLHLTSTSYKLKTDLVKMKWR